MRSLYDKAREAFGNGEIDWRIGDVKAHLIKVGEYTADLATHRTRASLGSSVLASAQLKNRKNKDGFLSADTAVFFSVAGPPCGALVITYGDLLVLYMDGAPAFPLGPIGTDIVMEWDPAGIFRI